jgi:hypothetical protein
VDIGQYPTQTIDVGDISKFNSIASSGPTTGSTAEGLLAHEIVEQFGLQTSGVNLADPKAKRERFNTDHPSAILVENQVNGNGRDVKMESGDRLNIMSSTYTKYFKEKNGTYTIESITTRTKNMKVTKILNSK